MSNTFYPLGAQKMLAGQVNYSTSIIKAAIVPSGYTYSAAHEFLADVGTLVGPQIELTTKTIAGGVFDADDINFGAVAPGSTAKAVVLYRDTGSAATSPLLCYLDEITGFPFNTNGGDVKTPWSDGPAKIFSLL